MSSSQQKKSPSLMVFFFLIATAWAQPAPPADAAVAASSFRPNVAVVIGIFSILFSLAFLLLIYARFCHSTAYEFFNHRPNPRRGPHPNFLFPIQNPRNFSGIDKAAIESLPLFRFSALKGARAGLECAVCISQFKDSETLRLLPKCNHAFHLACVDRWLESHSTCPLCRCRVDPEADASLFLHNSSRFASARLDNVDEVGVEFEIFVEREQQINSNDDDPLWHKFEHRIRVLSDNVVFKSRWSNIDSSDFVALNSEMLNPVSSCRRATNNPVLDSLGTSGEYSIDINPSSRALISPGNRCMSEITNVSRSKNNALVNPGTEDEKVRRVWLPIARRTVQRFAGRERRVGLQQNGESLNVRD